jgi:ABC-2 type transport system ATP-binding protein
MIELSELYKSYGDLPVLQGVSLSVGAGEAYGLLGPNGAGKSTLIHLMLGFLRPNRGRIRLLGSSDLERTRRRIGYIPERQRYHTRYSAREYLRFLGAFSGLAGADLRDRVDRELATVGLAEVADRGLGTFSKGMLQRLGVAQALLTDPDLLLIDEPTSGLDPAGQREVLELLNQLRVRGHTVLLCTHHLHEVELLCDRVGVLAGGRIAAEAALRELRGAASSVRIQTAGMTGAVRAKIEALGPGITCDAQGVRIGENTPGLQAAVLRALLDGGALILALEPLERPIERLYLQAVRGAEAAPPALPAPPMAPPGDSNGVTAPWLALPALQPPPERRRGEGDTLLKELLGRDGLAPEQGQPKDAPEDRGQEPGDSGQGDQVPQS